METRHWSRSLVVCCIVFNLVVAYQVRFGEGEPAAKSLRISQLSPTDFVAASALIRNLKDDNETALEEAQLLPNTATKKPRKYKNPQPFLGAHTTPIFCSFLCFLLPTYLYLPIPPQNLNLFAIPRSCSLFAWLCVLCLLYGD